MRSLAFVSLLLFLPGCPTKTNPQYCDDASPCPGALYCDVDGDYGAANRCVELGGVCAPGAGDQCTADPTYPICDAVVMQCRPCRPTDICPDGGVCDVPSGECVPATCTADQNDCGPGAPVCEEATGTCTACEEGPDGDSVCAGHDEWPEALPYCVGGRCAECRDTPDCTGGLVCDPDNYMCVACTDHTQCLSGACNFETGTCWADIDILYVDKNNGAGDDTGDCTADVPCLAIDRPLALIAGGDPRSIILVLGGPGTEYVGYHTIQSKVMLIGQGATLRIDVAQQNTPVLTVTGESADVQVERLLITGATGTTTGHGIICDMGAKLGLSQVEVSNNGTQGLVSTGCASLAVERSTIKDNRRGGIFLVNTPFQIRNNFIVGNGDAFNSAIGGVSINNPFDSSPQVFDFNTVYGNAAMSTQTNGVKCTTFTLMTATGNIIHLGSNQYMVSGDCNHAYSNIQGGTPGTGNIDMEPVFVDVNARDYHLAAGSGGIDIPDFTPASCTQGCTDFDGDARPLGNGYDMGADEYIP